MKKDEEWGFGGVVEKNEGDPVPGATSITEQEEASYLWDKWLDKNRIPPSGWTPGW